MMNWKKAAAILSVVAMTSAPVAAVAQAPTTSAPRAGGVSAGYILGPDDTIDVSVYGQPDLSQKTRIKSDGTINLPMLGVVQAGGLTVAQLIQRVTDGYKRGRYLVNPSVNIEVSDYVSRSVTVLGNVANPGNYPLDRDYTVPTMVARAGGVSTSGANVVELTRKGASAPTRIQLADGGVAAATPVQPGDTLFVPPAEMVYVYGQVTQPGAFPWQPGMTYRQALARAGGPTLAGSTRKIEVRRGGAKVKGLSLDDTSKPEDVLVIKEKLF